MTLVLTSMVAAGGLLPSRAQSSGPDTRIDFNIPVQPLSRALVAYGTATGLEIFYNAALADKQHSAEVVGVLTPSIALQILLRGTGYVAKTTGLGAFTIMPAPPEAAPSAPATVAARRRLEPYFGAIQARISDALCRNSALPFSDHELLFQFWLAPSGIVAHAEVIGETGTRADDQTFATAIRGLALIAPPADMSQPVNMVIFPPSRASKACGSVHGRRGGE